MEKTSKRWVVLTLFAVSAIFITAICQASEKEEFKSGYGFFVKALKQFPYPYKLVGDQQLGTLKGSSGINPLGEADAKLYAERYGDSSELKYLELYLVTREDKLVTIKLVGNELDLKIFWHELSPNTGKYKFWEPVILFSLFEKKMRPYGDRYWVYDIDIVGRFFIKRDTWGGDPNKILGYENEMYYR